MNFDLFRPSAWTLLTRVTLGFSFLGAMIGVTVSLSGFHFVMEMESRLVRQTLEIELADFIQRRQQNPRAQPPVNRVLKTYIWEEGEMDPDLANQIRLQDDALARISWHGTGWFVLSQRVGNDIFTLLLEDTHLRQREYEFQRFLVWINVLTILFSTAFGRWLALRTIQPVRRLADQVAALQPSQSLKLDSVEKSDELEFMRRAFIQFSTRLDEFVARERAFTTDASHELRTPVGVVMGAVEVLKQQGQLDEVQERALARIERAGTDMEGLIYSLMSLARERDGEQSPDRMDCQLLDIVDTALADLYPLRQHKKLTISVRGEAASVQADCRLLKVVVANLIRNAFVFTRTGEVRVMVTTQELRVEDSGPGMTSHHKERLFEKYFQGRSGGMAGIGLELSQRIAHRYGWDLVLENREDGQGVLARLVFLPQHGKHHDKNQSNH